MLLSPIAADVNNVLPGLVPPPSSSGGGATGFAEQLQILAAMMPSGDDAPAPAAPQTNANSDSLPSFQLSVPGNSGLSIASLPNAPVFTRGNFTASFPMTTAPAVSVISSVTALPIVEPPVSTEASFPADVTPGAAAPILTPDTASLSASVTPSISMQAAPSIPAASASPVSIPAQDVPSSDPTPSADVPVKETAKAQPQDLPKNAIAPSAPASTNVPVPAAHEARIEFKSEVKIERRKEDRVSSRHDMKADSRDASAQPQVQTPDIAPMPLPVPVQTSAPAQAAMPAVKAPALAPARQQSIGTDLPAASAEPIPVATAADRVSEPKPETITAQQIAPVATDTNQIAFAVKVQSPRTPATPVRTTALPVRSEASTSQTSSESLHIPVSTQRHGTNRDSQQQPQSQPQAQTAKLTTAAPVRTITAPAYVEPVISDATPIFRTSAPASTARPVVIADDIPVATKPEVPATPMKDISVRIQSEQGENVDVRIMRRAGDLQIAVKSADGETTQGLRHGLSDLSDKLNASGYHAETWHPGHAASAETTADSGNSQNSQQQSSQGESQSHSGWSQENRGQRDNNQSNRPRWIEEFESTSTAETTGQFHGLIR